MNAATEHNLLFGLLALQNGLVDQARLVAAFHAWTLNRSRTLADHLVALGHLDTDDRDAVSALVRRHLKRHGDDLERSLAAVPASRSTRERLAALGDAELTATIARVGAGATQAASDADTDRTPTYTVGNATAEGGRFRVLRPHARGGLGAVFVALDAELNREVALKQILDAHADDDSSRQRFLLEAEITGGLEHPGIVPVYGLGAYGDGRPFYAMWFIRGDSLKEAIEHFHRSAPADPGARSLELRRLLRRFTDVCNAIEYAHSRGVLHRDIKPGNVIVGRHGETLVVDWGLAKATGRSDPHADEIERTLKPSSACGSAETLPGQVLGTPAYMSPEQARGDLAALGPPSDIYSLGGTLYCLLTGTAPFAGDAADVLAAVERGEFRPPRAVDPSIDRGLEAICLKAMVTRPEDRYSSARALGEDVERWLADEPVAARAEPLPARAARWVRRRRTLVTAAAAVLAVALAGLTAGTALLGRANARAEAARERAEASFEIARAAIDRNYKLVNDAAELKGVPRLEALRRALLETTREFYRKFLEERRDDAHVAGGLGLAHLRLGSIDEALGFRDRAIDETRRAVGIFERLAAERPHGQDFRGSEAEALSQLGLLLGAAGSNDQAERVHRRAAVLKESLAAENPGDSSLQSDLAGILNNLAMVERESGRSADAERSLHHALEIQEDLVRRFPKVQRYRVFLANHRSNLGLLYHQIGRPGTAIDWFRQAVDLCEGLAAEAPENPGYRKDLAAAHLNLAVVEVAQGRLDRAEAGFRRAEGLFGQLARESPDLAEYPYSWAAALHNLGRVEEDRGQTERAEAAYRKAQEISDRLVEEHPDVVEYRDQQAKHLNNLGSLYHRTGRLRQAVEAYRLAVDIRERLARDRPMLADNRISLVRSYANLAEAYFAAGSADLAARGCMGAPSLSWLP
jgi:serine/threonine-protein kinase